MAIILGYVSIKLLFAFILAQVFMVQNILKSSKDFYQVIDLLTIIGCKQTLADFVCGPFSYSRKESGSKDSFSLLNGGGAFSTAAHIRKFYKCKHALFKIPWVPDLERVWYPGYIQE